MQHWSIFFHHAANFDFVLTVSPTESTQADLIIRGRRTIETSIWEAMSMTGPDSGLFGELKV